MKHNNSHQFPRPASCRRVCASRGQGTRASRCVETIKRLAHHFQIALPAQIKQSIRPARLASRILLFFLLYTGLAFLPVQAQWVKQDHTSVRISSDYQMINGSEPFWLLIEFQIKPGWHTYWRNPGDSGMAPVFKFNLPEGFRASPVHWLPPQRYQAGTFVNYGYADNAYHLIKITPKQPLDGSFVPIEVDASWLVCAQECVPEQAVLSFSLRGGDSNQPGPDFDRIRNLVARTQLSTLPATVYPDNGQLKLVLAEKINGKAYFYPDQKDLIRPGAKQQLTDQPEKSVLAMQAGKATAKYPVSGIVEVEKNDLIRHYRVKAPLLIPAQSTFLPLMLLFAVLGGLILNLMPCVFPILSLKILALKSSSNKRLQGLFYTLGVVLTFCTIALLMLILQAFGQNIGWGFQLQSPIFNISLIFLFTLISLNLFGFFEIPFSLNTNLRWQNNHQYLYSFATGVLACVVATPCSAPFMATAVGVALGQDALTAMLIFIFLGLGLALPYLLICFIPALAGLLPKPGAWMETLKQLLAFPMLLSVIWLLWVLGQQVQYDAVILLMASLCFVLFTFWLRKRLQKTGTRLVMTILSLSLVGYPLYIIKDHQLLQQQEPAPGQEFSVARLAELQEKTQKVFVYATAAWCITCQINEKVALDTERVKDFFKEENITVLKADWTNQDARILRFLQSFGRAGVPLYVYYPPGKDPVVLPQLLRPGTIMDTIRSAHSEK